MNSLIRSRLSGIALILLIPMALVGCVGMTCRQCVVACVNPCMRSGTIVGLLVCMTLALYTCAIPICGYDPICQCKGVDPCDEVVDFPDTNLKQAMLEQTCRFEGDICVAHLILLDDLYAEPASISDLTGLEYCTELHSLDLNENQISDIYPLAGLTGLVGLLLDNNEISDLSPLAGLTKLALLHLDGNQISDLSPLAGLTDLLWLGLSNNQISELTPLAGLTSIDDLDLSDNQISDISPLAGLTGLRHLYLDNNEISDISPLPGMTRMEQLDLSSNQISDLGPLAGMTDLDELGLSDNQISDILPLVNNSGIDSGDEVSLGGNPLSSTSCTVHIPELESRGVNVYHDCP
jgi:hypothetical protein